MLVPRVLLVAVAAALLLAGPVAAKGQREVTVFAAASLANALEAVCNAFTAATGIRAKLSFAASSTLARQIESGAAAQIFLAADEAWMSYLDKRKLLEPDSRRAFFGTRLVLVVPADRPLKVEIGPDRAWLARLPAGRIATGDPAHVPVGRYAEQALRKLGAWTEVAPRLARADNVRSALVLVERGEAAAGIVYETDARASRKVSVAGLFPDNAHAPIVYEIALLRGHGQGEARALYEHIASPAARAVLTAHGFIIR